MSIARFHFRNLFTVLFVVVLSATSFLSFTQNAEAASASILIDSAKVISSNAVVVTLANPGNSIAQVDLSKWHIDKGISSLSPVAGGFNNGTVRFVTLTFAGTPFADTATVFEYGLNDSHGLFVDAGGVTDNASNTNAVVTSSSAVAVTDGQSPTFTASRTGMNTIVLTFSENVQNDTIDGSGYAVSGATVISNSKIGGSATSLTTTGLTSASPAPLVTYTQATGTTRDASGNEVTNGFSAVAVSTDTVAPTITVTDDVPGTLTAGTVTYTILFSEPVTGFTASDVSVAGGTKGVFTSINPSSYTLVVTPLASSTSPIVIDIASAAAQDASGNGNVAALESVQPVNTLINAVTTDTTAPTFTADRVDVNTIVLTFSKPLSGFSHTAFTVDGATTTTCPTISNSTQLTLTTTGLVSTDATPAVYYNALVGNFVDTSLNELANGGGIIATDHVAPTVSFSENVTGTITSGSIIYDILFSEGVMGFTSNGVEVSGGTKSSFVAMNSRDYRVTVTPYASSTQNIVIDIPASVAQDFAGNYNIASIKAAHSVNTVVGSQTVDHIAPTVSISDDVPGTLTSGNITYTFIFSEPVQGFTAAGILVSQGTKLSFTALSSTVYRLIVMPNVPFTGNLFIDVLGNVAHDYAGNGNIAGLESIQPVNTALSNEDTGGMSVTPTNSVPENTAPNSYVPADVVIHDPSNYADLLLSFGLQSDPANFFTFKSLASDDASVFSVPLTDSQSTAISNFETYGASNETIKLGSGERHALIRDYFETVGRADVSWSDIQRLTIGQKPLNRNLAKEQVAAGIALRDFTKMTGHSPNFQNPSEDLAWNTILYRIRFPRNLTLEQQGIEKYKSIFHRTPSGPLDWAEVRALGYALK